MEPRSGDGAPSYINRAGAGAFKFHVGGGSVPRFSPVFNGSGTPSGVLGSPTVRNGPEPGIMAGQAG